MRKEGNEGCVEADVRDASVFSQEVLPCCSAASDHHHFGRDAFRAVLRGTHDVVDTRGHTRSGHIAAVPSFLLSASEGCVASPWKEQRPASVPMNTSPVAGSTATLLTTSESSGELLERK